jgi:hypothetical protein
MADSPPKNKKTATRNFPPKRRRMSSKASSKSASKGKTAYKFKKKTPLASKDSLIPRQFVTPCNDSLRIMSTAAKGTTVLVDSIMCVDAGNLPVALAKDVKLLMITHGHADHIQDACNAFHDRDGKVLVVFCPAIMAHDLFCMIRTTYQANKGRPYPPTEILDHLKIYGVVRPNDETFNGATHIAHREVVVSPGADDMQVTTHDVAELVQIGDVIDIDLGGRAKCAIRPFHCHHTVDTVGYGIYSSSRRLNPTIRIPQGTVVEITPPKMTKDDKKRYKAAKAAALAKAREDGTEVPDINMLLDRVNFDTADAFCRDLEIPADVIRKTVVSREMGNGFILDSIRRIEFMADVEFDCFAPADDSASHSDECVLPRSAFHFFKDYEVDRSGETRLDIYHQVLTPKVMVFGDTAATVFSQRLVRDMVAEFPRVVIESTFLDGEDVLSRVGVPKTDADDPDLADGCCSGASACGHSKKKPKNAKRNLYLRLKDKKHIFLPELYHLFARHPDTEFVLMHFSDRYDRESVMVKGTEVRQTYPNVFFAV